MSIYGPGYHNTSVSNKTPVNNRRLDRITNELNGIIAVLARLGKPKKDVITVWAEERGPLRDGAYEWSFGNSGNNKHSGYHMTVSGRILRMSLSSVKSNSGNGVSSIKVNIVINGVTQKEGITKIKDVRSAYTIFTNPIEVMAGSVINLITSSAKSVDSVSVVAVIVELDL